MLAVGVLTDQGDAMFCERSLYESCRMGRCIDADSLICSLGLCECDGHTVHKLSQRHLSADWLAPRESDCSRMRNKVSSDWLPSYFKATRTVLEIFKMAGYFPDRPCTWVWCKWGTRSRLQRYVGLVELHKFIIHLWRLYICRFSWLAAAVLFETDLERQLHDRSNGMFSLISKHWDYAKMLINQGVQYDGGSGTTQQNVRLTYMLSLREYPYMKVRVERDDV